MLHLHTTDAGQDTFIRYNLDGGYDYALGVDDSDTQRFKLTNNAAIGGGRGSFQMTRDGSIYMYNVTLDGSTENGPVAVFRNTNSASISIGNHRRVIDIFANTGYNNVTDYFRFYVGSTGDGYISNSNGTLGFVQESDRELKKDIVKSSKNSLDIINNIEIVDFTWKDDEKAVRTGRQTGVIAQQVQSVLPAMVTNNETLGVMYEVLHPHYIKAIQQLTQRIEQLEKKLSKYE
jgi:hypothetical protein